MGRALPTLTASGRFAAAARLDRRSGVGGEGASGNGLRSRQTHIQNETLKSKKLQSENIDCNHLDAKDVVSSTAVIDILEARYIRCHSLKTEDYQTFGTNELPLFLAHTRQKRLKVDEASSSLKVVTKVPVGISDQTFYIDGLDLNLDFNINVTLNKDNHVYSCLINDGVSLKVNLKYDKLTESNTIAKIYVQTTEF